LDAQFYFVALTDVLRTIVSNNVEAIGLFRACDDPKIVRPLVWAARNVSNSSARINATLVLGNIVDNTTVCFVLHHLRDPKISINGRANLLGVTLAMAGYAYEENAKAIEDTIAIVQRNISTVQMDLTQTQKLIADIGARVRSSANRNTPLPPSLREPCASYGYSRDLE